MLKCGLFAMTNFFKANRCVLCPKVFCCPECRCKHETAVHKTHIICFICAKISKSPLCNQRKQFTMNSKPIISAMKTVRMSETTANECSPRTPSQDNGNVKQLIAKFSRASETSYLSNDKEKKSVCFDTSVHQGGSKQFSMQVGATSTPYQSNIPNKSVVPNEPDNHLQDNIDEKEMRKEENTSESTSLEDVTEPTANSNSNLLIYGETQGDNDAGGSKISDLVTISMTSKDLELTDILNSKPDITSSSPVENNSSTLEERDNILNEETDSQEGVNMILWSTACSFSDHTEENKKPDVSSDEEQASTSSQCLQVFKSAYSDAGESASARLDGTSSIFNRSSSIADLSQGVWQTITNSIMSALTSTKDICNMTGNISKRSLDIIDYPSAKRRKYEPYLKCRPPIHELGIIVLSKFNSSTISRMNKATQTEDCYFT